MLNQHSTNTANMLIIRNLLFVMNVKQN